MGRVEAFLLSKLLLIIRKSAFQIYTGRQGGGGEGVLGLSDKCRQEIRKLFIDGPLY